MYVLVYHGSATVLLYNFFYFFIMCNDTCVLKGGSQKVYEV